MVARFLECAFKMKITQHTLSFATQCINTKVVIFHVLYILKKLDAENKCHLEEIRRFQSWAPHQKSTTHSSRELQRTT